MHYELNRWTETQGNAKVVSRNRCVWMCTPVAASFLHRPHNYPSSSPAKIFAAFSDQGGDGSGEEPLCVSSAPIITSIGNCGVYLALVAGASGRISAGASVDCDGGSIKDILGFD